MIGECLGAHRAEGKAITEQLVNQSALVLDDAALFNDLAGEQQVGDQQDSD
jgi:hypothetical protein